MGQAKRRGTFEQRQERAKKKNEMDKLLAEYLALSAEERLKKFIK